MKIAIRYFTKSKKGNTEKLAKVISSALHKEALNVTQDLSDKVDRLFLVNAMYAANIDAEVKRFQPEKHEDKVPCMGWNAIYDLKSPLYKGFDELSPAASPYVYFVHSYYVPVCEDTIATADYVLPYSASMHKNNFYTCQFHPEKSGKVGERIIKNFLDL